METLEYPRLCHSTDNTVIEINSNPFTIGRGLTNNYVLPNKVISREHCSFEKHDNHWFLRDTSTNGTYVNGTLVHGIFSEPLKDCDNIQLEVGIGYKYTFRLSSDISDEQLCLIADSVLEGIDISNLVLPGPSTSDDPLQTGTSLSDSLFITSCSLPSKRPRVSVPTDSNVIDLTEDSFVNTPSTSNSVIDVTGNFQIVPTASTSSSLKMVIKKVPASKIPPNVKPELGTSTSSDVDEKAATGKNQEEDENSQVEDEFTCAICSEMFVKATTLNCSHTFCKYCINKWRQKQSICPICRTTVNSSVPTLAIDNFIEKIVQGSSKSVQDHRKELLEDRKNLDSVLKDTDIPPNHDQLLSSPITLTDSNDEDDSDTSSLYSNSDDWQAEYLNVDWYESGRRPFYGGYGRCYVCQRRGHWANSCPFR